MKELTIELALDRCMEVGGTICDGNREQRWELI